LQEEPIAAEGDEKLAYESPVIDHKKFHFADHFDDVEASRKKWVLSQAKKDDIAEEISKYDGIWNWESPQRIVWANDLGLVLKSKAKHAAISAPLRQPFEFKQDKPLVVQYEVTLQVRHPPNCSRIASAAGQIQLIPAYTDPLCVLPVLILF